MKQILKNLYRFANEHSVILEKHGEIGFCRPCVGFIKGNSYIAYNPRDCKEYDTIPEYFNEALYNAITENAYHKDDYMAVLVKNDDYEKGLTELNQWVENIEKLGKVSVVEYSTGATGIQASFSGSYGHTLKVSSEH